MRGHHLLRHGLWPWLLCGLMGLLFTGWPLRHAAAQDRDAVVLIGHPGLPRIDTATAQRLYTGRAVELGGVAVDPVNLPRGVKLRERFMADVMEQDDARYVAYWTVRKHIGKGTPPRELKTVAEVIDHVTANPGGIGYVTIGDLRAGMNVVLRP